MIDDRILLVFAAEAGRSYAVEYRDELTASEWLGLTNVPAQAEATLVRVEDHMVSQGRFYRLLSE